MTNIFVILNESISKYAPGMPVTEIVQPARWQYQDAMDDLTDLAKDNGVEIDHESTSVFLPVENSHLESDEYYIIELEVTDRG